MAHILHNNRIKQQLIAQETPIHRIYMNQLEDLFWLTNYVINAFFLKPRKHRIYGAFFTIINYSEVKDKGLIMNMMKKVFIFFYLFTSILFNTAFAAPLTSIARLSLVTGSVSLLPAGED